MKTVLRIVVTILLLTALWWTFLRRKENVQTILQSASTETRLLLALDDTHTGLVDVAAGSGTIAYANPAALEIFGYDKMDGLEVSAILPESMRPEHARRVSDSMKEGAPPHVAAMKCFALRKNGETITVYVRVHISKNGVQALVNRADEVSYHDMTSIAP